jgi:Fe2+ or Zn2+ uptake regulation protein
VESLYDAARVDLPMISLKTVYQTVHDLEAMGEVNLLHVGTGSVRVDPNVERTHHHLICERCGSVRDVFVAVEAHPLPAEQSQGFEVTEVDVHFRGVCASCAGRRAEAVPSGPA